MADAAVTPGYVFITQLHNKVTKKCSTYTLGNNNKKDTQVVSLDSLRVFFAKVCLFIGVCFVLVVCFDTGAYLVSDNLFIAGNLHVAGLLLVADVFFTATLTSCCDLSFDGVLSFSTN